MKAKLEFDLPEEQSDFLNAVNGIKYKIALWDLDQWLRARMKYEDHLMEDKEYEAYEKCRKELHNILTEYSINLED